MFRSCVAAPVQIAAARIIHTNSSLQQGIQGTNFPFAAVIRASSSRRQEKFIIVKCSGDQVGAGQTTSDLFVPPSLFIQAIRVVWEHFTCCPWPRTALPGACPTWRGDVLIKPPMMLVASEEGDEEGEGKDGAKVIVFWPIATCFCRKTRFSPDFTLECCS